MIDVDEVGRIASLARLHVSSEDAHTFGKQLDEVLGYARQLEKVDTCGVEPTAFVVPSHDALRDDTVTPSLAPADLQANAPCEKSGFFAVPRVIST